MVSILNLCNLAVVKWHEVATILAMGNYVKEMTVKKVLYYTNHGEYGLL